MRLYAASSLVNSPGRSQPKATRCAPVSVAMSITISGFSSSAHARASANNSRPSASVFPTSTVILAREVSTSDGRKAFPPTLFSAIGMSTRRRASNWDDISIDARPRIAAAPPMSFFMASMALGGFRSSPPVSNTTPFPTRVRILSVFPVVAGLMISTNLGGRSEAFPTAWTIGKSCSSSAPSMTLTWAPLASAMALHASCSSTGPM
mmetsp:Transcript_9446/g.18435  ORF Transcript_9446/g.18435 Transcript_9446/m.18435 type:complete len:207 (+) Transcript_9446:505-1125(+)